MLDKSKKTTSKPTPDEIELIEMMFLPSTVSTEEYIKPFRGKFQPSGKDTAKIRHLINLLQVVIRSPSQLPSIITSRIRTMQNLRPIPSSHQPSPPMATVLGWKQ